MICQGCGGVLGRDCYNQADCIEISRRQNQDYYDDADKVNELQHQIYVLLSILIENNIELPEFAKQKDEIIYNSSTIDDLPF